MEIEPILQQKLKKQKKKKKKKTRKEKIESGGFDIEDLQGQRTSEEDRLVSFSYYKDEYESIMVAPYAKMGLHWYNLKEGTKFEFHHIEKFSRSFRYMPGRYDITFVAEDPATCFRVTFQTILSEINVDTLSVRCDITRPINEAAKPLPLYDWKALFNHVKKPAWPSDVDPFKDDRGRFYKVGGVEMRENTWLRLYLNLAFLASNRAFYLNRNLFNLKHVNVAVETEDNVEPPSEKLKGARNATFYIKFKQDVDWGGDNLKGFERRCVVKRTVDLISGCFYLTLDSPILESVTSCDSQGY